MFYWLAAIPFFIALMMLAVTRLPEHSELKRAEDMQTEASVFRMANQHDAAVRYIEGLYKAGSSITSGIAITQNNISGYLPSNYIADYDLVKSYVICTVSNCSLDADNSSISILTILDPVKGVTYLDTDKSKDFIRILGNYKASFPMRKVSGEGNNYKGFTNKQSTTFAGRIINKTANNGFMMEQKEGDNYVLPNEVYNFKIGEVNALGEGEPAIITVIGKKPKPQVCTDTAAVANSAWIGKAALCSKCRDNNTVQRRHGGAQDGCYYPAYYNDYYSSPCLTFPTVSQKILSNWKGGKIYHYAIKVSNKPYHIIGPAISWWETEEVCEKLGLKLLTRSQIIAMLNAYGKDNNGDYKVFSEVLYPDNPSDSYRLWTSDHWGNKCHAYLLTLYNSSYYNNYSLYRSDTGNVVNNGYGMCGPKI